VKDPDFAKEYGGDAACLALADLRAQANEQRLDVLPGDVGAGWVRKDSFDVLLVRAHHVCLVPENGTAKTNVSGVAERGPVLRNL
jgi:hypothetical protein